MKINMLKLIKNLWIFISNHRNIGIFFGAFAGFIGSYLSILINSPLFPYLVGCFIITTIVVYLVIHFQSLSNFQEAIYYKLNLYLKASKIFVDAILPLIFFIIIWYVVSTDFNLINLAVGFEGLYVLSIVLIIRILLHIILSVIKSIIQVLVFFIINFIIRPPLNLIYYTYVNIKWVGNRISSSIYHRYSNFKNVIKNFLLIIYGQLIGLLYFIYKIPNKIINFVFYILDILQGFISSLYKRILSQVLNFIKSFNYKKVLVHIVIITSIFIIGTAAYLMATDLYYNDGYVFYKAFPCLKN